MSTSQSMIEKVNSIISTAQSMAESMPSNGRIQLKEFAKNVATSAGVDAKDALAFVTFFARNTDLGYVSRGKNGGFVRGTKPTKPAPKLKPTQAKPEEVDSDDSDESDDSDD